MGGGPLTAVEDCEGTGLWRHLGGLQKALEGVCSPSPHSQRLTLIRHALPGCCPEVGPFVCLGLFLSTN